MRERGSEPLFAPKLEILRALLSRSLSSPLLVILSDGIFTEEERLVR